MYPKTDAQASRSQPLRAEPPYCRVGAGEITAALWKLPSGSALPRYRFRIFRQVHCEAGDASLFKPADLPSLVRLLQVLAATLDDDGCLPPATRQTIRQLAHRLDQLAESNPSTSNPAAACHPETFHGP